MLETARWLLLLCAALFARDAFAQPGGRATGHAEVTYGERHLGRTFEVRYSFAAVSTGATPTAHGTIHAHMEFDGDEIDVRATVDCLVVSGNQAWISGPVERYRANGVDHPQAPGSQLVLHVLDNGEGRTSPPDEASALIIFVTSLTVCETTPGLFLVPSTRGNIQVRP